MRAAVLTGVAVAAGIVLCGLLLLLGRAAVQQWRGSAKISRHSAGNRRGVPPRLSVVLAGPAALWVGWLLGGPVAATIAAVYVTAAANAWRLRVARRQLDHTYGQMLDAIENASSDLRAGLVPEATPTGPLTADAAIATAIARLDAACRISEALGTPLADLLDRVDADLRAGQRLRLNVRAQMAGAQATSVLLAGLPIVGLGLGVSMGFDPVDQLLHTPVGAGCGLTAVLLQCAGLAWTARLIRNATASHQPRTRT
jgi:tight adherence protein B